MGWTPSEIRDALETGDTDLVNAAIDGVDDLDAEVALERFDDIYAVCEDIMATGDGYQRQAAVRLMDTFGLVWIALDVDPDADVPRNPEPPDPELVDDGRLTCWWFFLEAVGDEDGRVRKSAVKALNTLATAAEYAGADAEINAALEELRTMRDDCADDDIVDHLDEAIRTVRPGISLFG